MLRRALLSTLILTACGKEEPPPPPPTLIDILVIDAATGAPIAGAELLSIDASGALGRWRSTDDAGRLEEERAPGQLRFRAQAAGYLNFPKDGQAFPELQIIEAKTATATIALEPDPRAPAPAERATIIGQVSGSAKSLLVVSTSAQRSRATYTDAEGRFALLGVGPGTQTIFARGAGVQTAILPGVQVSAGQRMEGLSLEVSEVEGVSLGGELVSGEQVGGAGQTTLYLVDPGSRAAIPGLETSATFGGSYSFSAVPDGSYLIQGGLELDGRILSAQRALESGPPTAEVQGEALMIALESQPAVEGLEAEVSTSLSSLSWSALAEADFYVVELFDAAGQSLWGGFDASRNPRFRVLAPDTSAPYEGPALRAGAEYRFRVYAAVRDPIVPSNFELIAASEEREGLFMIAP